MPPGEVGAFEPVEACGVLVPSIGVRILWVHVSPDHTEGLRWDREVRVVSGLLLERQNLQPATLMQVTRFHGVGVRAVTV